MNYSEELANEVKNVLEDRNWNYRFDDERGVLECGGVNLHNRLQSCQYLIIVREDCITTLAISPLRCQKDQQDEMAKYLTMANYGLRDGNFEMDFRDGEIRYKSYISCGSQIPQKNIIERNLIIPSLMFEKYGNGMLSVLFGIQSAENAYEEAENSQNDSQYN